MVNNGKKLKTTKVHTSMSIKREEFPMPEAKSVVFYRPMVFFREFMKLEAAAGIILLFCAILAMIVANSPLEGLYNGILYETIGQISVGALELKKPLILWINDGLMAVFFFLVALEIKREILQGMLSSRSQIILPVCAAIGGMAVPGLIYAFITKESEVALHGWAIPTATDIAFALGIFSLIGKRLPTSLKVFLLALAIIDDLGAITIIGLFYNHGLNVMQFYYAGGFLAILILLNVLQVNKGSWYIIFGLALWVCVLKSGVHATLAGVLVGFCIPLQTKNDRRSLLMQLEHDLHPTVAYIILPIFAFANAGVSLDGITFNTLLEPVTFGVIVGLFLGKQIGIFGATFFAVKTGLAKMPAKANWGHIWGVSMLAGIGFTMSLFITTLAFPEGAGYVPSAKLGILLGSLISALGGLFLLNIASRKSPVKEEDDAMLQHAKEGHQPYKGD